MHEFSKLYSDWSFIKQNIEQTINLSASGGWAIIPFNQINGYSILAMNIYPSEPTIVTLSSGYVIKDNKNIYVAYQTKKDLTGTHIYVELIFVKSDFIK